MNDFETVRQGLQDALRPEHYEAALDRIEAEVERLREEKRVLAENETWAQAEVERLRAALEECERDWRDTAESALRGNMRAVVQHLEKKP